MAHLSKMALSFCLSIETSPGWMEALIKAVKQHEVLIGDHGHDLVYDLRDEAAASLEKGENWFLVTRIEGENPDSPIYSLSSGAKGQEVDMLGIGWKEILEALAPYGITGERGMVPRSCGTKRLALPHSAARGRDGRANSNRDETAFGFSPERRAPGESDPAGRW